MSSTAPRRLLCLLPAPPPWSGPEVQADIVLRRMPAHGFAVTHVSTNVNAANARKGRPGVSAVVNLLGAMAATLRHCLATRPHLAYIYLSQNASGFVRDAALAAVCFGCRVPVVAQVHGSNFGNFYAHAPAPLRLLVRQVVSRLRGVILLAQRFRRQFDAVPDARLAVLPNGIDADAFRACLPRARRAPGQATVLYVGHLSVAKGFATALEAIPAVLAEAPGVRFEFAGEWLLHERNILFDEDGRRLPDGSDLQERWSALAARYPEQVRLLGTVAGSAKLEAFRRADIFLFPSYSEGFPMAVLEAMAAGLPLVTTPVGALAEILRDGENGLFVAPGDAAAVADAILTLARDEERRLAIGARNHREAVERYSPDAVVRALAGCFHRWAAAAA